MHSDVEVSRKDDQPIPNTHAGCSKENVTSSNFEANKFEVFKRLEKEVSLVCQRLSSLEDKVDKEISSLRHQLSTLEAKVDDQFNALKIFILESVKKVMADLTVAPKGDPTIHTSGSKKNCIANEDSSPEDANVNSDMGNAILTAPTGKHYDVQYQREPSRANTGDQSVDDMMLPDAGEERSVTHNTPTFDEFDLPDLRKSQLVAMENKIPYVPTVQEPRAKTPRKHARPPFTDFSETDNGSVQRPTTFRRKHPFNSYANFEVPTELVDSFQLWIKQKL